MTEKANTAAGVAAHWKFDSRYFKEGSLEEKNLILQDLSGNGNELRLNTERVPEGEKVSSYISFPADNIEGDPETQCLWISPKDTEAGRKTGAFFETVPGAPLNEEEFCQGYTIEVILKLPAKICDWSGILGQKGTGRLAGMQGGEPESNGGLNISESGEMQWNPWTTNNQEVLDNPTTWSDAGGMQYEKWHYVVIKNDGVGTVMIVDGVQVQRCNTFQKQVGIRILNTGEKKGWVVGTSYWSEADTFSEITCGDSIFRGYIQEIRMSRGLLDSSEYLVQQCTVDERYEIPGDNEPYPHLAHSNNYTVVNIPDPQYQTQYKPEIVEAQTEWIRDNREKYHIVMTLCVGDLSQDGTEREYKLADRAFSTLDRENIPYLVTDGNHDNISYKKYFGGSRYQGMKGYRGTGPSGISSYSVIQAGSYEYLFLSLPWEQEDLDADKEWVLQVLQSHPENPTVIFSHFNEEMETYVKPFDQVFMTVRGHIEDRWVDTFENDYGHTVIDVVTNYQFDLYGGNGWLSTMEFDEEGQQIIFHCYSPWVEKKRKILEGALPNGGILLPDEMQLFSFDKLCNRMKETDNTTVSIDFKKRFKSC